MEIEPKNLKISLHRNERWGFVLVAACALASAIAWMLNSEIAVVFTVSCAVVLPVLWLFLFPPHTLRGKLPRSIAYLLVFGYLALAKVVIIPLLVGLFHAGTAA